MSEQTVAELRKLIVSIYHHVSEEVFAPGGYGNGQEIERQEIKSMIEEGLSKQTLLEVLIAEN